MQEDFKKILVIANKLHQENKLDLARTEYKKLLKHSPKDVKILYLIGTLEIQSNNFVSGSHYLLNAINLNPNIAALHNNLAVAYTELSNFKDAFIYVNNAISLKKNYFEAYNTKGNIFFKQKKIDDAIENYKQAIFLNPKYIEGYNNLGIVYKETKKFSLAEKCFQSALSINPNYLSALINLGINFYKLNQNSDALKNFEKAIKINPNYAEAHINIAKVLVTKENYSQAQNYFKKAISMDMKQDAYYNDFAIFYIKLKKYDNAISYLEKAIKLNSNSFEYFKNIGICYFNKNQFNKSIDYFKKSLLLNEKSPDIYNFIGYAFSSLNKYTDAKNYFLKSIELDPNFIYGHMNLGNLFKENNKLHEAIIGYEKALALDKNIEFLKGIILNTKMMVCDWVNFDNNIKQLKTSIKNNEKVIRPFALLSLTDNPRLNQLAADIFSNFYFTDKYNDFNYSLNKKNEKIKIGYFSSDFNQNHPVSHLMSDFFQNHDKNKFEIYAFSIKSSLENDSYRKKIKKHVKLFLDFEYKSDDEVVSISRKINLDIAVDLNGHTQNARTMIFSKRVAPIQINFLGFPGTMGSNIYDYIIADKFVIPEKNKEFYNEKVLYMPDSYIINPSFRKVSNKKISKISEGFPEKSFVFCCFNNSYKILPNIHDKWVNILNKVENGILWLADTNHIAKKNILSEFSKKGINDNRIFFAKRLEKVEDHLERYKLADLFLDTFPFNAHTTACDALFLGLPVLTIYGKSFSSRVGLSLLKNLSMHEFITRNEKEYEEKAIYFSKNIDELKVLKQKLKTNVKINSLYNSKLYLKNLEELYKNILH